MRPAVQLAIPDAIRLEAAPVHPSPPFEIPCFASPALSAVFGADVSICDVTLGPTSSWKDCVAVRVVEAAQRQGLKRVVVASSGNHGRAIAFACRAAGLPAAVLVYDRTPADVIASLVGLGAQVFRFPGRVAVHAALDAFVADGWFSATLTDRLRHRGAMPGVDGYRRIAVAIARAVADEPIVIVPTCYGDGASSIRRHLVDLGLRPTLCLVRPAAGDGSIAASIATDVVTPQVAALLASGALDIKVDECAFRSGVGTMETALGKPLDFAEGGIPEALARLATIGSVPRRSIVCVVTGGLFPGLDHPL